MVMLPCKWLCILPSALFNLELKPLNYDHAYFICLFSSVIINTNLQFNLKFLLGQSFILVAVFIATALLFPWEAGFSVRCVRGSLQNTCRAAWALPAALTGEHCLPALHPLGFVASCVLLHVQRSFLGSSNWNGILFHTQPVTSAYLVNVRTGILTQLFEWRIYSVY